MKTRLAVMTLATILWASHAAAADVKKVPRAAPQPQAAASTPAAPVSAPVRQVTSGHRQHQLLGQCNQKLDAAGITGAARKRAMAECLRAS